MLAKIKNNEKQEPKALNLSSVAIGKAFSALR